MRVSLKVVFDINCTKIKELLIASIANVFHLFYTLFLFTFTIELSEFINKIYWHTFALLWSARRGIKG